LALTTYIVNNVLITATDRTAQIILFTALTDEDGDALPVFTSAPMVSINTPKQDRRAYVVNGTITTTQFQIKQSFIKGKGGSGYYNLRIRGE